MKRKTLSAAAFCKALDTLELNTYDQAAVTLGVSRRSLIRYAGGHMPVPPVVEYLLDAYLLHGIPPDRQATWTTKGWRAP